MLGLRRALLALFALGVIFAGLDVALALTSTHEDQKVVTAILGPLIGLSFIGTGVFAWWRRPLNRFGLLMTGVGIAWFLAGLTESNNSTVFTIGSYVEPLYLVHRHPDGALVPDGAPGDLRPARDDRRRLPRRPRRAPALLPARRRHRRPSRRARARTTSSPIVDAPDLADVFDYTATFVAVAVLVVDAGAARAQAPGGDAAPAPRAGADAVDGAGARVAAGHRLPHRRPRSAGQDRRRRRACWRSSPSPSCPTPSWPAWCAAATRAPAPSASSSSASTTPRPTARSGSRWPTRWATARSSSSTGARRPATTSPTTGARSSCPRRARAARSPRSSARASASARSSTTPRWPTSPGSCARWPPPPPWPWRTSAWRPSCARASTSCRPRARGWWRSRCSSAGAWSATCTTAPSSAWSRSRCSSGWPSAAWRRVRTAPRAPCSTPRATSWPAPWRSCASWRAASIRPS